MHELIDLFSIGGTEISSITRPLGQVGILGPLALCASVIGQNPLL